MLRCSVAQASRLLWSVTTETGLLPIQVWYLRRASTIAYASFSPGDYFFCRGASLLDQKATEKCFWALGSYCYKVQRTAQSLASHLR